MPGFQINAVTLSGNLVRDPELNTLPSGVAVCRLRLASNERYKDQSGQWSDRPQYFDVSVWRGVGEHIAKTMHRGDQIVVQGRLRWREWEDKESRQKRSAIDITADSVVTMPRAASSQPPSETGFDTSGLPDVSNPPPQQAPSSSRPTDEDDDIPFVREPDYFEWEPWHAHEQR